MKKTIRALCCMGGYAIPVYVMLCCMTIPASAQSEALPFVRTPHDPHSMAMGGAGVASSSSVAYASYTNAAAIPFAAGTSDVALNYQGWCPGSVSTQNITAAGVWNAGGKFGVAAGFTYGIGQAYEIANSSGAVSGSFTPSEIQANVGLSWRFVPWLSFGVNLKYLNSSLAEGHSYGAFASDIFLMSRFADFSAALGVSSLGSKVKSASGAGFSLPASAVLGLGYGKVFAQKHGVDVLVDLDYYFSGAFTASAGASYTFNDIVSVRGGYHYGGKSVIPSYASVGLGLKFFGVRLDAAYLIASGPLKNTFSVGLGYAF